MSLAVLSEPSAVPLTVLKIIAVSAFATLLMVGIGHIVHIQQWSLCSAVYITANISGGHLNPAVTLATMITGHIPFFKGLAYIFVQICGSCFGSLMVVSHSISIAL